MRLTHWKRATASSVINKCRWSSSVINKCRWSSSVINKCRWSSSVINKCRWSSSVINKCRWSHSVDSTSRVTQKSNRRQQLYSEMRLNSKNGAQISGYRPRRVV